MCSDVYWEAEKIDIENHDVRLWDMTAERKAESDVISGSDFDVTAIPSVGL